MNRKFQSSLVAAMTVLTVVTACGRVSAGITERVSVSSSGVQGNAFSCSGSISADGRFVVFTSLATNLVPNDTNGYSDVFVHDRQTGQTTRVSVNSSNIQGNEDSFGPSISTNGRFVAFESDATNLVAGDTYYDRDVFVHDRGQPPTDTPCSATLSSDLRLHMPVIDFQGNAYWADFQYVPNTLDFVLTNAGLVVDDTSFRECVHSVLSYDFRFVLPDIIYEGKSYWAQLTYKEGATVTLTWVGEN